MPYYFGAPWLPTFSGDTCTQGTSSFKEFKEKLKSMFRLYPLSEEQQAEIVIGQLKGPALREARSWSDEERRSAEGILNKLADIFNMQTIAELKGRLYARKQRPKESLREFALGLQEAMRAIQTKDPREVEHMDETLIDLFIEGARGEATRSQLRMWRRQNPICTFSWFKEAVIDILGLNQNTDIEYGAVSEQAESGKYEETQVCPMSETLMPRGTVTQQAHAGQDPMGALTSAVTEMMKEIREMRLEQAEEKRRGWRREQGGRSRQRWDVPQNSGRLPTNQFDAQGRPICRRCKQSGHIERNCEESLNYMIPRRGTDPREESRH